MTDLPTAVPREGRIHRRTGETDIRVVFGLDGTGRSDIDTGLGFLDHMLDQLARHGLFDIEVRASGDLHIDGHHTTEDTGIAMGAAVAAALGDRAGIRRYGHAIIPMDETLTRVAVDASNRPGLVWGLRFSQPRLGAMDTELFAEWFKAFAQAAGLTVHVDTLRGGNNHHMIEAAFKALARALRMAVEPDPRSPGVIPSTKGTLGGSVPV